MLTSISLVVADSKILDDILSHFLLCRIAGNILCFVEAAKKDMEWLLVRGISSFDAECEFFL
jgi:hypothetical protein